MKKFLLSFIILFSFTVINAQRVDIDNFRVQFRFAGLPTNYVEPDQRTYKIEGPNTSTVKLYGWEVNDENPTIIVKSQKGGFTEGEGKLAKEVKETKDKKGKVTKKTTYTVSGTNTARGSMRIYGAKNEFKTKRELEREAKRAAKKKKKKGSKAKKADAENPFLSGVEAAPAEDENGQVNLEKAYYYDLSKNYTYTTSPNSSSVTAWNTYNSNKEIQASDHQGEYNKYMKSSVSSRVNGLYGYAPKKKTLIFKTMDSKKHPENEMYNNAMNALKVILGKMAYNKDTEQIKKDAAPIVDYLTKLTTKYTEDKKHPKRIRKSAYYNLALYYQCVDMFDKSDEMAQKLIDTELDKGKGKKVIEANEDILAKLAFHKMDSRHLVSTNPDEEVVSEEEEEEEEEDAEEGGNK